ncbi:MAG: cobalamin-dependent protein, partial [Ferruginibacter sp.]
CTAATQLIMTSLYPYIFDSKKKGVKVMACTVAGDLHEIGIRMLSDVFELNGWDTYYMGASMPDNSIITALKEHQVNVLAISATMPIHISKVERLIKKIRSEETLVKLKIIVGGYPFNLDPELWNYVGADASAKDAREAVLKANQMISLN